MAASISLSCGNTIRTLRPNVSWKRRMAGGVLGLIGFMLSPLSWWNDLFVNVPLAVGFGWLAALFYEPAFEPAVVLGYWLTNVLGFVLLHHGIRRAATNAGARAYSWRDLLKDVAVSLAYTCLIVALVHWKVLQPVGDYFKRPAVQPGPRPPVSQTHSSNSA
ncbi:MAG TPA: hypothetical protein VNU68_30605 [Verrucomicrobiae bacterium]|nr:hypothetical protein [Verrucomicrobiae bacterium]